MRFDHSGCTPLASSDRFVIYFGRAALVSYAIALLLVLITAVVAAGLACRRRLLSGRELRLQKRLDTFRPC